MRMKARRRAETKSDTTVLMKRELHFSATQENAGQWSTDDECKKIQFFTDQVSENHIDR